jgi:hypothetical protein
VIATGSKPFGMIGFWKFTWDKIMFWRPSIINLNLSSHLRGLESLKFLFSPKIHYKFQNIFQLLPVAFSAFNSSGGQTSPTGTRTSRPVGPPGSNLGELILDSFF